MSYLRPGKFELIAHRGGSLEAPENTMVAFENAKRIYQESIFELDVHRTSDGEIVVFHDDDLSRATDGEGMIWNTPFDKLLRLDAAYHFTSDEGKTFPLRGKNTRIPLLGEVLTKFPDSRVSIEFKHPDPFFGDQVVKIIRDHKAENRVVLAGEDHRSLVKASQLAPEMCSGFSKREITLTLVCDRLGIPALSPSRAQVLQIPFRHDKITVATSKFVKRAHDRGVSVHVWTINDEATMRHLIEIGVDGIVTDAPSLLLSVARDLKKI